MANETEQTETTQTQQTQQSSTQTQTGDTSQQQTTQPQKPQFTYGEDRSKWIPDTRFKEVNTGYQTEKQKREALERDLATAQTRIQALAGVNPKKPEEQEDEEIRAAFAAKFPHLAELTPDDIKELRALKSERENLQAATRNHWQLHGRQMVGKAEASITDELGLTELTDRQKARIGREYVTFLEENAEKGYLDRHEAGDEKLIGEFVKGFLEDWREPMRKSVTTNELAGRRPVPSGKGRSVPVGGKKKIDFNDQKAFGDALVESFTDHGGRFGN